MARAKSATAVLLLSLALGTGVNAAVFGVLDALLLGAPPGVENPSRLVNLHTSEFSGATYGQSSHPDFESVKSSAASFAAIAAVDDNAIENVRFGEFSQSVRVAAVSEDFFPALQMRAHHGRLPSTADAALNPAAAVVSFQLSEQFGGAAEMVGRAIRIGGREYWSLASLRRAFKGFGWGTSATRGFLMAASSHARGDGGSRLSPG